MQITRYSKKTKHIKILNLVKDYIRNIVYEITWKIDYTHNILQSLK